MSAARKLENSTKKLDGSDAAAEAPAVWEDPAALVPWKKNPKPIAPKDVREMMRSIRRRGFGAPIVARLANKEIIEGHLRREAAMRLRLERVPVRYLDLSEEEAHLMALSAIKFEGRRETNEDEVAAILDDLEEKGVDLTVGTGFDDDEIDKLIGSPADLDEEPISKRGKRKTGRAIGGLHYRIVVECKDEDDQVRLLEWLEKENVECRPLMS